MEKNRKEGNSHSFHKPEARKRLNENRYVAWIMIIQKSLNLLMYFRKGKLNKCLFEKKSLKNPLIYIKFRNKHMARYF